MTTTSSIDFHPNKRTVLALWPQFAKDPETGLISRNIVAGATDILAKLKSDLAEADNDARLSQVGKEEQRAAARKQALAALQKFTLAFKDEYRKLDESFAGISAAIAPRSESDLAGTMIDLALAQKLAAMDPAKVATALLVGSLDPDLMRVAAVMPPALTGISSEQKAQAREAAIMASDPARATALQQSREFLSVADQAVQKAWGLASDHLTLAERRTAAPEGFLRWDSQSGYKTVAEAIAADPEMQPAQ